MGTYRMDTYRAAAMAEKGKDGREMVFDWDKAAKLITEHSATDAAALLGRDRPTWTQILEDGEPPDNEVWLASTWEVPTLEISEESSVPCWRWTDETSWDGSTYWPASALGILRGATPRTPR